MVQGSVKWNFSDDKCFEIIHLTIIDILSEKHRKILSLNALIENLNSRTKIYKLHNSKRLNMFSKYLKIEYGGVINFLESFNFYSVVKTEKDIYVKLYKNLVNLDDIKEGKRITKDSDWIIIQDSSDED
tara:strand:- start:189 stop:575 length:387 start_codon:yes stop_codon:yes gene_type:complete